MESSPGRRWQRWRSHLAVSVIRIGDCCFYCLSEDISVHHNMEFFFVVWIITMLLLTALAEAASRRDEMITQVMNHKHYIWKGNLQRFVYINMYRYGMSERQNRRRLVSKLWLQRIYVTWLHTSLDRPYFLKWHRHIHKSHLLTIMFFLN